MYNFCPEFYLCIMALSNYSRMLRLIDEVFATRSDPGQLQVTQEELKKLAMIHPATLTEKSDANGPLIWVLMIPTTKKIMDDFISGNITETELLERTIPGEAYNCIYLCSVTTLPEMRGKGETKALCVAALKSIMRDHAISTLFVWPFTKEGSSLAKSLAETCGLELKTVAH